MKFVSNTFIPPNKLQVVPFPSVLQNNRLMPSSIVIEENNADVFVPARDIQCKIMTGTLELENNQEAFFNVNDEIKLDSHAKLLQRTGDLILHIMNKRGALRNFRITVDYTDCGGVLMHQERYDMQYDKVFTNISNVGTCTRLVLSFNRLVTSLEIRPTCICLPEGTDFEWISTAIVSPCDTIDPDSVNGGRSVFVIADEDMKQLANYMEYLQLVVEDPAPQEVKDGQNLMLYAVAYGFPKK
jgi:hypothetical protein